MNSWTSLYGFKPCSRSVVCLSSTDGWHKSFLKAGCENEHWLRDRSGITTTYHIITTCVVLFTADSQKRIVIDTIWNEIGIYILFRCRWTVKLLQPGYIYILRLVHHLHLISIVSVGSFFVSFLGNRRMLKTLVRVSSPKPQRMPYLL